MSKKPTATDLRRQIGDLKARIAAKREEQQAVTAQFAQSHDRALIATSAAIRDELELLAAELDLYQEQHDAATLQEREQQRIDALAATVNDRRDVVDGVAALAVFDMALDRLASEFVGVLKARRERGNALAAIAQTIITRTTAEQMHRFDAFGRILPHITGAGTEAAAAVAAFVDDIVATVGRGAMQHHVAVIDHRAGGPSTFKEAGEVAAQAVVEAFPR